MTTPDTLLVLGAGRGQLGLLRAARRLGYHTVTASMTENSPPGLGLANSICAVDISNPPEVLRVTAPLSFRGVATCCSDTPLPALGALVDERGLAGLCAEAASRCADKDAMKSAFVSGGVTTPRFARVTDQADLMRALAELSLPVVVKATDLQGSSGVYICHSTAEAGAALGRVLAESRREVAVVEEYIDGDEFGAQAFVLDGEVLFVMLHGDEMLMRETGVPIGHYVPLGIDDAIAAAAETEVRAAITALGLDDCAVNVDMIYSEGRVYVIEITGRAGANCLPEITGLHYGIDYYEMIARAAMRDGARALWDSRPRDDRAAYARMLYSESTTGVVRSITADTADPDLVDVTWFVRPGDEVRAFTNSNDCLGQVVASGSNLEHSRAVLHRFLGTVAIDLADGDG